MSQMRKQLMCFLVHALTCNAHRLVDVGANRYQKTPSWLVLVLWHSSRALKGTDIALCIEHFVCNGQEHQKDTLQRHYHRAMHDICLIPFRIAQHDSNPTAYITAYNKVSGLQVSESPKILKDVPRGEWRWDGMIMSDSFGTYSTTEAAEVTLDQL